MIAIVFISYWMSEKSLAADVSVYMVKKSASGSALQIEIIVNVATQYLGSYDLGISFNQDLLQLQSLTAGTTHGQLLPEPNYSIKDGLLKTNGVFKYCPKGAVSLLFINFNCQSSNCLSLPFYLYVNGLTDKDRDISVDVLGYEITHNSIKRMQDKQHDQLPLVDQNTITLLEPIIGMRFFQKDLFVEKLIETIGDAKTTQYKSDILRLSRLADYLNVEMNCSQIIDIINCLQVLAGVENAACKNMDGDTCIGIHDVIAHFQKIAFFPISK